MLVLLSCLRTSLAQHKTWSRTRTGLKKRPGVQADPVWRGQSKALLSYTVTLMSHLCAGDLKSTPLTTRANWLLPADRRDRWSFECGAALPRILVELRCAQHNNASLALSDSQCALVVVFFVLPGIVQKLLRAVRCTTMLVLLAPLRCSAQDLKQDKKRPQEEAWRSGRPCLKRTE